MPRTPARFDFKKRVAYDPGAKRQFHRHAQRQLKLLAAALDLTEEEYDLRSNEGGIAISGEIILHADWLYVQVSQSAVGTGGRHPVPQLPAPPRLYWRRQLFRAARSAAPAGELTRRIRLAQLACPRS
jgi:hypothetical protein